MTNKLSITVNVLKLDKTKFTDNSYKNNNGEDVVEKNVQLDIIPLKEYKVIKKTTDYEMRKTHFVTQSPSKEERADKVKMPIIGSGIQFVYDDELPLEGAQLKALQDFKKDIAADSTPF